MNEGLSIVIMDVDADLSSLPVKFDRIGEKVIEKLMEFVLDTGDHDGRMRKLHRQFDLMLPGERLDRGAREFDYFG